MSALAHFALAYDNIHYFDLDAPLMLSYDPVLGGVTYHAGGHVSVPDTCGIGAVPDAAFLKQLEMVRIGGD